MEFSINRDSNDYNGRLFIFLQWLFYLQLFTASGEISLRDITIGLLFISFIVWKLYYKDFNILKTSFNKPVLIFFAFSLLSLYKAEDLYMAGRSIITPIFTYLVFYFMAIELVEPKKIPKYINILFLGMFTFVSYGLYVDNFTSDRFFLRNNNRGSFAAIVILFAISLLISQRGKWYHKCLYASGFLLGIPALFSHSRGGFLGFAGAILLWLFLILFKEINIMKVIMIILVVAIFIGAYGNFDNIQNRLDGTFDDYGDDVRIRMWRTSYNLILENPVLGIGVGNFTPTATDYVVEVMDERGWSSRHRHPHNLFVQIPLEQGIISLFIFGFLLIKAYMLAFKNYLFYDEKSWGFFAGITLIVTLTSVMIHSFVDYPLRATYNGIPIILLTVINLHYYQMRKVENE